MTRKVFLFGYGMQSKAIAQGLVRENHRLSIIESSEENYEQAKEDGYVDVTLLDVTKDEDLASLTVEKDDYLVCMMDDEHLNVFLTLSLRSLYPDVVIMGISDSIYTTQKLKMAGATKVIDLYHMSANRIHSILKKPVATKLLDGFLLKEDGISFKEIVIPEGSYLNGVQLNDVNFYDYNVILIGMIDVELSNRFIFVTTGINHKLDSGDTLVCIGEKENLENFESVIARSKI